MKSLIKAVAIAAVLAAPVASFAQSSQQPVSRADVRNELIRLQQAGYNPAASNDVSYPADIQAAERRIDAQNPAMAQTEPVANTSGYGAPMSGSSEAGHMTQPMTGPQAVYFGGQ
ncbi:conserved exported hypothetical protein [Paraburkholderia ribeironis]|uniref:DUF4148 domain-containing protein n=1 Tax=Paraburkholderia ribeironis TaxID=1247936 RepID=A0A1N7RXF0_9BURK|nr:DUF4148 domain-containing protein [Paraburkholderia ribeironis]SIT39714.1 conserved exported hypothetical protein [Paraburkholderia ribeironis]